MPANTGAPRSTSLIFPVLIALLLGAAGGYGYFRFASPASTAAIDELTAARDTLEKQVASQSVELDALSDKLAQATAAGNQGIGDQAALEAAQTRIADLQRRLEQQAAEAGQEKDEQVVSLRKRLVDLEIAHDSLAQEKAVINRQLGQALANATKTEAALREATAKLGKADVPGLTKLAQDREVEITRLTADLAATRSQLDTATRAADTAAAASADLKSQLQAQTTRATQLQTQLRALETVIAQQQKQAPADTVIKPDAQPADDTPETGNGNADVQPTLTVRDASSVDRALGRARGLDGLSGSDAALLRSKLISGECVTTSLETVFDRVPVISLRNLIRDLKSNC